VVVSAFSNGSVLSAASADFVAAPRAARWRSGAIEWLRCGGAALASLPPDGAYAVDLWLSGLGWSLPVFDGVVDKTHLFAPAWTDYSLRRFAVHHNVPPATRTVAILSGGGHFASDWLGVRSSFNDTEFAALIVRHYPNGTRAVPPPPRR
jgi:hypothetical protein